MGERNLRKRSRSSSILENTKTIKGIFEEDALDDSISSSHWGLLIDENQTPKSRLKRVKISEETLLLICDWNNCKKNFNDYPTFDKHLKDHLQNDTYPEEEEHECLWWSCSFKCAQIEDLHRHVSFHGYHTRLKSTGANVLARIPLPQCTQSTTFEVPELPSSYCCQWEYCYEYFNTPNAFFEHMQVHVFHSHKSINDGHIFCKWKGCTAGNFASQTKLAEHIRVHTGEKVIACPTCGNMFANRTKFSDHRKRQLPLDRKSYLCSQCCKYFPSERLLRDHMRLHINNYKCSMCEMTCPKPSILAKHIRYKHLVEKPFKCQSCDYSCVTEQNYRKHLDVHSTVNVFKCNICNYKCRSSVGLDRHNQKIHDKGFNNIYECHNCQKRFGRGGILTKHLRRVHNYHWPAGHSRFRYTVHQDGIHRLQTVRYETIDVTQEILQGNTASPSNLKKLKFNVLKKISEDANAVQQFDVVVAADEEATVETEDSKKVFITISDVDCSGNVLKSETIQSSEIKI